MNKQNVERAFIELNNVIKEYRRGADIVIALDLEHLEIDARGLVGVIGPSGSGKSTLLHLLGAMDRPTRGTVLVAGQELERLKPVELTRFRGETVGFVFQSFNLIPNLTAAENVALPMEFTGRPKEERRRRAAALLEQVELWHRVKHRPHELSGGEQQRVAIARALANNPRLILADEPTGNLDSKSGQMIYKLLKEIAGERLVIVVTHDLRLSERVDRVVELQDGRLISQEASTSRR